MAPVPAPSSLARVSLDDKYALETGRVFITGTQALVRLPMMQRRRDLAAGLNTACYISGYRGSPVGGLDQAIGQAGHFIDEHHIRLQPGVNEEIAATAVWGSQQSDLFGDFRYDGVFGLWYAKGPGVDRAGDALKHANLAGTARHGGVVALAGDDHTCKSSTTAHQSEFALIDAAIPILHPAGVQEFIDFGLYGWAMSRFSGCWTAMKLVAETTEASAAVDIDPSRIAIRLPQDVADPPGGRNIQWPSAPFAQIQALEQEARLHEFKLPAAVAFVRANRLDRVIFGGPRRRVGIVTTGKSYLDVRQALDDLGIDEIEAGRLGLSLLKLALVWPIEPEGMRAFAEGLDEVLVVEEKRSLIEQQIKETLFHLPSDRRPWVTGKTDEKGRPLLSGVGELSPTRIARVIVERLKAFAEIDAIETRLERLEARERSLSDYQAPIRRIAYFCSGCPHSTSTQVPEGSRALAGIGCHYMAQWMDRNTKSFTQMGGEGASWLGQAPFSETPHVFQNVGDGTYFHSGSMVIRAAVAANVSMTFKILYNDAVAMTGGQKMDGPLDVPRMSWQLWSEGVVRTAVVTDEPDKYPTHGAFAPNVTVHHRDALDQVQQDLRAVKGVTALVYDQVCAAEKRRRRKRGEMVDPARRVFINPLVCEGCGDCGVKSNCVSIVPIETEFGRRRAIDQSSCNKDFSCLKGFCPSFVTVEGGTLRKRQPEAGSDPAAGLPEPAVADSQRPYGILVTGVGGTGVVTVGAILAMAAHLEGKGCTTMDMTGLAQKGGAVVSHVRIADDPAALHAVKIAAGGASLLLGCDIVVAASADALSKIDPDRTRVVANTQQTVTGDFTRSPDMNFPIDALEAALARTAGKDRCDFVEAGRIATSLLGDSIAANMFLAGYASQKGLLPVSAAAIERAIELNGTQVGFNRSAFRWGRRMAHDPQSVEAAARTAAPELQPEPLAETLDDIVAIRAAELTEYQNAAYAGRYRALVARVADAERAKAPGFSGLAETVARNYFRLLAYKDEYEVARLFTDGRFADRIASQFEGDFKLNFHLAPPLAANRDPATGHLQKRSFGPWMLPAFRILARLKFLRGGAFDIFGRSEERKMERRLIAEYEAIVERLLTGLAPDNHALAIEIATLPVRMRGFGHVKAANVEETKVREAQLLARYEGRRETPQAAE
ncbi:MAG: indolepyruvate ferredoxin oxidoreductase family protein [Dongiaceae bacterium]